MATQNFKKNNNFKKPGKQVDVRTTNVPKKVEKSKEERVLYYSPEMTVADIAKGMDVTPIEVIKKLMMMGVMAAQTATLDRENTELIALEFDYEVKDEVVTDMVRFDEFEINDDPADLVKRPAVVTIMGHVDHGKTTLLDAIRNTRVTAGEAGGITQHIGAYQVEKNGELITFIDTPGHAAFTEMRARGASVTDITILVVAADDGVMPQTKEAIEHAQAAKCPIIVAVNKMDKPGANPDKVMQELLEFNLVAEEWGGSTMFCKISAKTGEGLEDLLETILLVAEVEEYKANPNRMAIGSVIEARVDKGKGTVATVLVQNGTLKVGDILVCGDTFGKIRSMSTDTGRRLQTAAPSTPVEITGLNDAPMAGDKFMVFKDEKTARVVSEQRAHNSFMSRHKSAAVTLDNLFSNAATANEKVINVIIKGDTQGSIEALRGSLTKIEVEGARVNAISARVGTITDTDVSLAAASKAIIIGFNVRPNGQVRQAADEKGVEIRFYNIIYKAIEEFELALTGMLDPVFEEVVTGQAEIRDTFKISRVGTIAGCFVTEGHIERNSLVRILRSGIVVFEGKMESLKRFKDEAKEVKAGYECGIKIAGFNDLQVGDIIEASVEREVKKKK